MEIQPQLVLLQKTLFSIEGLGRQLYPDLDLWGTAQPFLEKWLRDQAGPKTLFDKIKDNVPYWSEMLPEIPGLLVGALEFVREQKLQKSHMKFQEKQESQEKKMKRKSFASGVLVTLVLSGLAFTVYVYKF